MKFHWSKFFWADWESDEGLKQCSLSAQGLWMRMLCICAKGEPRGYLTIRGVPLDTEGVARAVGIPEIEAAHLMAELERWGVFSRDRKGRIYSRRMVRDEKKSVEGRKHVTKRWSQAAETKNENVEPNRSTDSPPTDLEARSQNLEREESDATASPKTTRGKGDGSKSDASKGTRLAPDWEPDDPTRAFIVGLGLRLEWVLPEFRDHWCSVPGAKGYKRDWNATLRNRGRDIAQRQGGVRGQQSYSGRPEPTGVVAALRNLSARAG